MARNVIHLFGASGSGTSTLGRYISEKRGFFFMDTDDYFWLPTDPPFTTKRDRKERIALMQNDILTHENVVISGSLSEWGDGFIPFFTLAVRLVTDTDTRISRIEIREHERFGARIDKGGDMYEAHRAFIQWASEYDTGDVNMRSCACHDEWQKLLSCELLTLDGAAELCDNFGLIAERIPIE